MGGEPDLLSRETVHRLIGALNRMFQGLQREVEAFVLAHIAGMPVLLVGPHGSGKTRLTKAFYSMLCLDGRPLKTFSLLLKEKHTIHDVFYRYDLPALMRGEEKIVPLAVDAEAVFLDEIFANLQVLAALKDFLEERLVDRFRARWLFFTAATNPRNQFYETLLDLRNYADIDRFGVAITIGNRSGAKLGEIIYEMSRERGEAPLGFRVDVSNLGEIRQEIRSLEVSARAYAFLTLLCHSLTVCYFTDLRDGNSRARIDKFMVLRELPCRYCRYGQNDGHFCSRYAASPNRLARDTLMLARAYAWLEGKEKADQNHVVKALHYTLPHRLYVIDDKLLERVPTITCVAERCLEEFTGLLAVWKSRQWLQMLSHAILNALYLKQEFRDVKREFWEDPVMLSFAEDLEAMVAERRPRLAGIISKLSDPQLLAEIAYKADTALRRAAEERMRELRGLVEVTARDIAQAGKLIKRLLMAGAEIDEKTLEKLSSAIKEGRSFYTSGKGFEIRVVGGTMIVSAEGELGKAIRD